MVDIIWQQSCTNLWFISHYTQELSVSGIEILIFIKKLLAQLSRRTRKYYHNRCQLINVSYLPYQIIFYIFHYRFIWKYLYIQLYCNPTTFRIYVSCFSRSNILFFYSICRLSENFTLNTNQIIAHCKTLL